MQHTSINGISTEHLSVMDRGLQYGDGLFETIACVDGNLQFWDEHIERMQKGAERLLIDSNTIRFFNDDVSILRQKHNIDNCTVKLMLTRGLGERGYRSPIKQKVTRIVTISDLPVYPEVFYKDGVDACICQHPVSINLRLAGIKHLNRLDNVMARSEWKDEFQEGLMLDESGNLIEGTMSNVFSVKNNVLITPSLERCGVNGIIRDQLLSIAREQDIKTVVTSMKIAELKEMDELFVCNSVIGVWPIKNIDANTYQVGPLTQQLAKALQQVKQN
jgi:4-amino-4-deoxychorismate lyase